MPYNTEQVISLLSTHRHSAYFLRYIGLPWVVDIAEFLNFSDPVLGERKKRGVVKVAVCIKDADLLEYMIVEKGVILTSKLVNHIAHENNMLLCRLLKMPSCLKHVSLKTIVLLPLHSTHKVELLALIYCPMVEALRLAYTEKETEKQIENAVDQLTHGLVGAIGLRDENLIEWFMNSISSVPKIEEDKLCTMVSWTLIREGIPSNYIAPFIQKMEIEKKYNFISEYLQINEAPDVQLEVVLLRGIDLFTLYSNNIIPVKNRTPRVSHFCHTTDREAIVELLDQSEFSKRQITMLAADVLCGTIDRKDYTRIIEEHPNSQITMNARAVLNFIDRKQ